MGNLSMLVKKMLQLKFKLISILLIFALFVNVSVYVASDIEDEPNIGIILDERFIEQFEIVPGTQILMAKIANKGFVTHVGVMLRFEGLPKGVTYKIQPDSQSINRDANGTYEVAITASPVVDEGEYNVTAIAYTISETLAEKKLKVVIN